MKTAFDTVPDALQTLRQGGVIILADDESRENEGDLVALAADITPETVHMMLREAAGLMCTPVGPEIAARLGLTDMVADSTDPHQTPLRIQWMGLKQQPGLRLAFQRLIGPRQFGTLRIRPPFGRISMRQATPSH